jgi:hypothetical protein
VRQFQAHQGDVAVWLLHPFRPEMSGCTVQLLDGSTVRGRTLNRETNVWVLQEPILGALRLPQPCIREMTFR